MQWFQHDVDSSQDAKIKKLLIRHGAVGYAVYFHCLELIASDICETNLTFELEHDSEIIADNLKIEGTGTKSGMEIVQDIMRTIIDLDLFSERNGHIFCVKLIKRINLSQTSNVKFREAIAQKKEEYKHLICANHDGVMTDHDLVMNTNQPTIPTNIHTPKKTKKTKEKKQVYGKYQNVILTDEQIEKLSQAIKADPYQLLDFFSEKKEMNGYDYKNDYAALCNWGITAYQKTVKPAAPVIGQAPSRRKCDKCDGAYDNFGFCDTCGYERPI